MATSLYDLSVPTFLQTVSAIGGFLDKAATHCAETGADPDDFSSGGPTCREDLEGPSSLSTLREQDPRRVEAGVGYLRRNFLSTDRPRRLARRRGAAAAGRADRRVARSFHTLNIEPGASASCKRRRAPSLRRHLSKWCPEARQSPVQPRRLLARGERAR
jgi:hypothetical protein